MSKATSPLAVAVQARNTSWCIRCAPGNGWQATDPPLKLESVARVASKSKAPKPAIAAGVAHESSSGTGGTARIESCPIPKFTDCAPIRIRMSSPASRPLTRIGSSGAGDPVPMQVAKQFDPSYR